MSRQPGAMMSVYFVPDRESIAFSTSVLLLIGTLGYVNGRRSRRRLLIALVALAAFAMWEAATLLRLPSGLVSQESAAVLWAWIALGAAFFVAVCLSLWSLHRPRSE